jgi:hypothetical protein
MNCSKCSASVDYRFSTICPRCESDLTLGEPLSAYVEPSTLLAPTVRKLSFGQHVGNAVLVLLCSFASTILGATAMFLVGGILYRIVTSVPYHCGLASALAYLSILMGGFLGCTTGAVFGYRNRISAPR